MSSGRYPIQIQFVRSRLESKEEDTTRAENHFFLDLLLYFNLSCLFVQRYSDKPE